MTDVAVLVLVFGLALLLAVLSSRLASRSPLSTSLVFLMVGLVVGPLVLDVVRVEALAVEYAAEVALFAILFTDGQHAPWSVVRANWGPPTRSLVLAMPLGFCVVAALGHWVAGLPWLPALVLGAVLAPTDPVFASALVGRDDVPGRVRSMLNIESGVNDGLALPAVLLLAGLAGGDPEKWSTEPLVLLGEAGLGVALGVVLPLVAEALLRIPGLGARPTLQPLGPLALALVVYGTADLLHANQFLAAFVAGVTTATLRPAASDAFRHTGELVSEVVKGAALLAFATLLTSDVLGTAGLAGVVVAVGVIAVSRPLPVLLALLGSTLSTRGRLAVAWFGPKGFASVAYAVIVASSGMDEGQTVLALAAVTVLLSILAHSSTDTAVARALQKRAPSE